MTLSSLCCEVCCWPLAPCWAQAVSFPDLPLLARVEGKQAMLAPGAGADVPPSQLHDSWDRAPEGLLFSSGDSRALAQPGNKLSSL